MLTFVSILTAVVVGVLIAWLASRFDLRNAYRRSQRITMPEFILGSIVVVGLAVLVTIIIGPRLSRDGAINGFREFLNGSVTQARINTDTCERDGSCVHHYDCDSYQFKVVDRAASTDSKGNYTSEISHYETRYHSCPYVTKELDYVLEDNIGSTITIGDNYFESNPHQWRGDRGIPGDVPREPPARWLKAKADLVSGMSDPVTRVSDYANFILASDSNLYKKYSGSITTLQKAGLLPKHTANLGDNVLYEYGMQARKVQAIGGLKVNLNEWQNRLMRFNAALGSDQQGDMHIVLVPASKVSNPDEYIIALKAYWTSLGKWSISKNGIILAIGASPDGKTVEWSRAATGMPTGNGEMLEALKFRLAGKSLDPSTLLGDVTTDVREEKGKLKVTYGRGVGGMIGQIVFGEFPFKRSCMKCTSKGDKGVGYVDLTELVPITTGAKVLMFFIVLVLSCCLWGVLLVFDPFNAIIPSSSNKRVPQNRFRGF